MTFDKKSHIKLPVAENKNKIKYVLGQIKGCEDI